MRTRVIIEPTSGRSSPTATDHEPALAKALSGSRAGAIPPAIVRRALPFLKLPSFDFAERDQAALRLIPQHKPHAPEALQQRQMTDVAQFGVVAQHARKPVTGNTTTEMVHVVDADIGREPAQQQRQIVMRAAIQGGLM